MDVRFYRTALLAAATLSLAAGYSSPILPAAMAAGSCQSQYFVVTAETNEFARQVCTAAERFRRDLAIEWLGRELPQWQSRCQVRVTVGPHLGAGGATSFAFVNGRPIDFQMTLQGSRARVLDSVLPHEILHTVLATHYGRQVPRWADEGAATSVEHISERSKQQKLLIEFLTSNRGIPFNQMFAMTEYPRDILPLYSQGYSLARFLIALRGKRAYVNYVGEGMRSNNWTAATEKHYGLNSLSTLQIAWLDWVKQGSPHSVSPIYLASHTQLASESTAGQATGTRGGKPDVASLPADHAQGPENRPSGSRAITTTAASSGGSQQGWYSRQRDLAAARDGQDGAQAEPARTTDPPGAAASVQQLAHPQTPQRPRQMALPPAGCSAGGGCPSSGTLWR